MLECFVSKLFFYYILHFIAYLTLTIINPANLRLQKSLPLNLFDSIHFCLFALGDRAYGPTAFCAAGRKLASRLLQLGAKSACPIGYGDDGTPKGGVFADLDDWIKSSLMPSFVPEKKILITSNKLKGEHLYDNLKEVSAPYRVKIMKNDQNIQRMESELPIIKTDKNELYESYFFQVLAPKKRYIYDPSTRYRSSEDDSSMNNRQPPLKGKVISNSRITAEDWNQDVRHIKIRLESVESSIKSFNPVPSIATSSKELPYRAGDVAIILPENSMTSVENFIKVLPHPIQKVVDMPLDIQPRNFSDRHKLTPWPCVNNYYDDDLSKHSICLKTPPSLRTILTRCAAINALPEREDLRAVSYFCRSTHPNGLDQASKLQEMSEPSSDLYVDYILRQKRSFGDLLFDFDSIGCLNINASSDEDKMQIDDARGGGLDLTIEFLLSILPPLMPRAFSIASSPLELESQPIGSQSKKASFDLELCVAVVNGKTPLGRKYEGVCSTFLARMLNPSMGEIRLWIRPGSFTKLPLELNSNYSSFTKPVLCIGAGTGVAPLRSILREREFTRQIQLTDNDSIDKSDAYLPDNILCFGCRKASKDYYYSGEWKDFQKGSRNTESSFSIITAFSQDQIGKMYVQRKLREVELESQLISRHILEKGGAIYIAGGAKMAKAVKDEIIECLGKLLEGGVKDAKILLKRLGRKGLFAVEAWS